MVGANLQNLEQKSDDELFLLVEHYDFCKNDGLSGDRVLDVIVKRGSDRAEYMKGSRLWYEAFKKNKMAMDLLKSSADKGNVESKEALKNIEDHGIM